MIKMKSLKKEFLLNSISYILLSISVTVIVITIIMIGFIKQEANTKNNAIMDTISAHVEMTLQEPVNMISYTENFFSHDVDHDSQLDSFLNFLLYQKYLVSNIYMLDEKGKIVSTSPPNNDIIGNDFSRYPFFYEVKNSDNTYWSNVFFSYETKNPKVSISKKFKDRVIVCSLELGEIAELLKSIDIGKDNYIALVDVTGRYIAHTDSTFVDNRLIDPYYNKENIIDSNNDSIDYFGVQMNPNIRKIPHSNWTIIVYQSQKDILNSISKLVLSSILISLIVSIFAITLNRSKIEKLFSVINKITNGIKIVSNGDYENELALCPYNDLNNIINPFNEMTARLATKEATIRENEVKILEMNKDLEQQVILRTEELEFANEELEKSFSDLQSTQNMLIQSEKLAALGELVAGISHEIRTPLGALVTINSFMEVHVKDLDKLYTSGKLSKKHLRHFIDKITDSVALANMNINRTTDFVDSLKKTSINQLNSDKYEFNVCTVINDAVTTMSLELKKNNIEVNIECEEEIKIFASPNGISQSIINLIHNAIKHAFIDMESGVLKIIVTMNAEELQIIVIDNGCGVSEENIPKLFDTFFTTARDHGGTGLGLNIIMDLLEKLYDGTIECESIINEWTKFTIKIPQKKDS